jgi:hypothetical protein
MYAKIALLLKKNIRFAHYFVLRGHKKGVLLCKIEDLKDKENGTGRCF